MPATYSPTQYGGARSPAVSGNGGANVLSNLASGAFGMLSGGGPAAIQAALDVARDGSSTQAPVSTATQSTGSKVFNLSQSGTALNSNPFWANMFAPAGGSILLVGLFAVAAFVLLWKFAKR